VYVRVYTYACMYVYIQMYVTFENFSAIWYCRTSCSKWRFSKVRSLLNLLYEILKELTLEYFRLCCMSTRFTHAVACQLVSHIHTKSYDLDFFYHPYTQYAITSVLTDGMHIIRLWLWTLIQRRVLVVWKRQKRYLTSFGVLSMPSQPDWSVEYHPSLPSACVTAG